MSGDTKNDAPMIYYSKTGMKKQPEELEIKVMVNLGENFPSKVARFFKQLFKKGDKNVK